MAPMWSGKVQVVRKWVAVIQEDSLVLKICACCFRQFACHLPQRLLHFAAVILALLQPDVQIICPD